MFINIPRSSSKIFEIMSPQKFLKLLRENRGCIKSSKFIAPELGTNSFGEVYVEYRYVPRSTVTTKS